MVKRDRSNELIPTSQRPRDPNKFSIKEVLRKWAFTYFSGFFSLRGDNPLVRNGIWPWLQKVASEEGKAVLVKKTAKKTTKDKVPNNLTLGEEGIYLVGTINEIRYKPNALKTAEAIMVSYETPEGETLFEEDLLKPKFPSDFFIVLGNTFDYKADLEQSEAQLNFMNVIFRSMIFDLEIFRPRLIVKTNKAAKKDVMRKIRRDLDSYNLIAFASPDDNKPWELEKWTPESRFDKLRAMWELHYNLFKETNNIRFNTSNKTEGRSPVKEVELNEDQFEGMENIKQQARETFLWWCHKLDGGEDYQLVREGKVVYRVGDKYDREEKERQEAQIVSDTMDIKEKISVSKKKSKKNINDSIQL